MRLCYDGLRYSEDLGFSAGEHFGDIDFEGAAAEITRSLEARFDVKVRAKRPADREFGSGVGIKRWWIVVDTVPERPDIPSQRIKLEIASVPSHTRAVRRLSVHYPSLPQSYGMVMAVCQTAEEIMADKIVAFAHASDYVRYRDLWDISWLMNRPDFDKAPIAGLVRLKHADYQCDQPLDDLLREGAASAAEHVRSDAFRNEMTRFIPGDVIERTIARPDYLELMAQDIEEAYRLAMEG